jgi:hypothetical protein
LKQVRPTHPKSPLYFPPKVEADQEQADQLSVDFSQLTGQASDAQVPETAVTQHKAAVLASAALTGTPTAPTPAVGDNSTKVATTAFVLANTSSPTRGNVSVTTASLADKAVQTGVITLGKSSLVVKVQGSVKCRVRLYSTAAYRLADAARDPGIDPTGEHGVMLDILFPAGNLTWDLSPLSLVTNDDGPPISDIYYSIQNLSGGAAAITVTVTRIIIEG